MSGPDGFLPDAGRRFVTEARLQQQPRLFALDVDHTLITSDQRLTSATVAAVDHARSRGAEVLLASSRPPRAMWRYLQELGLFSPQRFISLQGALTGSYDEAGVLTIHDQDAMPLDAAHAVLELAEQASLAVNWYRDEAWYASRVDAGVEHEAAVVGFGPEVRRLHDERQGPHKLLLINTGAGADATMQVAAALPATLVGQQSNTSYLEITARGVDKAAAIAKYAEQRSIDRSRIVAMGDGQNDLGMFTVAGTSVAPANAVPATMAAADYVTMSNDEDGVAVALHALLP